MVKIKQKKEMTLPELIQWGWKNHITEKAFYSNLDGGSVYFNKFQNVSIEYETAINETFAVEVEEEITEDTIFPLLLKIYETSDNKSEVCVYRSMSINATETSNRTISYYLINNDGTLILIWKGGELVD